MNEVDKMREQLGDARMQPTNLADLLSASAALKNAMEVERSRAEIESNSNKSESLRFWVPVLAPVVGAAALVVTLIVQSQQFGVTAKVQRDSAEDAAWREMTKDLREGYRETSSEVQPGRPDAHASNIAAIVVSLQELQSFFRSQRYGRQAHDLAATMLPMTGSHSLKALYPEFLETSDWESFDDLAKVPNGLAEGWSKANDMNQATIERLQKLQARLADLRSKGKVSAPSVQARTKSPLEVNEGWLSAQVDQAQTDERRIERDMMDMEDAWRVTTNGIADFLRKQANNRPQGKTLNFRDANLNGGDWSSLDLTGLDLTDAIFQNGDLSESCVCSGIVDGATLVPAKFDQSRWNRTAWWRAASISDELLAYLSKRYSFSATAKYPDEKASQSDYDEGVERLRLANQSAGSSKKDETPSVPESPKGIHD